MDRATVADPAGIDGRMPGMVTAVRAGGFLFFSAVRGWNPKSKGSDDVREQAARAFENMKTILEANGLTMRHVVKVTMYLNDLNDRDPIHEVWMRYFPVDPPARTAMQVANASASPDGKALFVMDVIALAA